MPRQTAVTYTIKLDRQPDERPVYFWVADKIEVMVFKDRGRIRAFSSICPHMGGQLCRDRESNSLHCSWHPLEFDLRTLESNHEQYKTIKEFHAEVRGNELFLSD